MNGTLHIAVDLDEGVVQLGAERVRLLPDRGDGFYLNNRRGPMVRALRFEERSLLLTTADSNGDVATLIADAAFVSSGYCDDAVRVAVSLALAGGGEEAPSFAECARLVEQQAGWNPEQVSGTLALVIDRLCSNVESNGWERIVFEEGEPDLETLIARMVLNLSNRAKAIPPVAKTEAEEITRANTLKTNHALTPTPKHIATWPDVALEHPSNKPLQPTQTKSFSSASSVLPVERVKRVPARVLPPKPPKNTDFKNPLPVAAARTNQANISLTQTAPAVFEQPLFTSPSATNWQPLKLATQLPKPELSREQTPTRFSPTTESPSFNDWLSELATLLEAECDLRGIDP